MFQYVSLKVFIISFLIGLFFVYMIGTENKKIIVYPTPQNISKIQYKDVAENCFSYVSKEVPCPENGLFTTIPVQQ
jgi:hypothetical protein